jgi:hypothetical protein
MRFTLEEDPMNRRVPIGLLLLLPALVYWLSFLLGEGVGFPAARDLFALFTSADAWGFVLGLLVLPLLALGISFHDYTRQTGSRSLDGLVILSSILFLLMAALGAILRPVMFL